MRLLLVEDNERLTAFIRGKLAGQGHVLESAATGEEALTLAAQNQHDAIIVDRMLAGELEGLAVIQELRAQGNQTPVLILSALAEVDERIRGLRAGGDDYLTKPFAFDELMARLEVLVRRTAGTATLFTFAYETRWLFH